MKKFVPDDFKVPDIYRAADIVIKKFREENNDADYNAVMANVDLIKKIRGGKLCHSNWPAPGFSPEDNLEDVKSFIENFRERSSFAYIIWNKDESKYLGCIYINPIEKMYPELSEKYDVDFSMWVIEEIHDSGKYADIYKTVWNWLKNDWPFDAKRVFHRNAEVPISIGN